MREVVDYVIGFIVGATLGFLVVATSYNTNTKALDTPVFPPVGTQYRVIAATDQVTVYLFEVRK